MPSLAHPTNMPLSRKLSAPRLKIIRLPGVSLDNSVSPRPTIILANCWLPHDCHRSETSEVRNSQRRSGHTGLSSVPPDCQVSHRGRRIQRRLLQTPKVGWQGRHWTMNSAMSGVHRTVWCAHPRKVQPTTILWLGPINTPIHHRSMHPSIPLSHIQYKSKESIPRYIQSFQSPQAPQLRQVISSD
jgi:hypothetical protein